MLGDEKWKKQMEYQFCSMIYDTFEENILLFFFLAKGEKRKLYRDKKCKHFSLTIPFRFLSFFVRINKSLLVTSISPLLLRNWFHRVIRINDTSTGNRFFQYLFALVIQKPFFIYFFLQPRGKKKTLRIWKNVKRNKKFFIVENYKSNLYWSYRWRTI